MSNFKVIAFDGYLKSGKNERATTAYGTSQKKGVFTEYGNGLVASVGSDRTKVTVDSGMASLNGLTLEAPTQTEHSSPTYPNNTKVIFGIRGYSATEGEESFYAIDQTDGTIKLMSVPAIKDPEFVFIAGDTVDYPTLKDDSMLKGEASICELELGRFEVEDGNIINFDTSKVQNLETDLLVKILQIQTELQNNINKKQDVIDPKTFIGDNGLTIQKKNGSSSVTINSFDTGLQIKSDNGNFINLNDDDILYTGKGNVAYEKFVEDGYVKKIGDIVSDGADFKNSKNAGLYLNNDESKIMAGDGLSAIAVATKGVNISSDNKVEHYAKQGHSFSGSDVSVNGSLTATTDLKGNLVYAPYGFKTLSDSNNIGYMQVKTADGSSVRITLADQNQEGKRAQTMTQYEGTIRVTDFLLREDQFSVYFNGKWHLIEGSTKDTSIYGNILNEITHLEKTRNITDPLELLKQSLTNLDVKTRKLAEDNEKENERFANTFKKRINDLEQGGTDGTK